MPTASIRKQQQATASNSKQQQATASNSTTITPSNQTQKDQAMSSAAQSGVKVSNTGTKVINANQDNYKDAEKQAEQNYQDQINKAKETQKQQETNTNNYNQALDKYNKDKAAAEAYNKQQQDKYNSDLDAYNKAKADNKAKNDEITNNNAEIDKANQKLTDEYNQKKAAVDAQNNAADTDHANKMAEWQSKKNAIDAENAAAQQDYQNKLNEYNRKLADFNKNNTNGNKNGLTAADFKQHLTLDKSPNANYSIEILANRQPDRTQIFHADNGSWLKEHTNSSEMTCYFWNSGNGINGDVVRVTYTNLNPNDKYVDKSGNEHKIAKIVRTVSNLGSDTTWSAIDHSVSHIRLFKDPTDGVQYSSNVTVHDDYYDENNNKINIDGNAYITLASLNNSVGANDNAHLQEHIKTNNDTWHVEQASTPSNKIYSLVGSSVTVHDNGWAYADHNNDKADGSQGHSTWTNPTFWDNSNTHADLMYYGAAVADATDKGGTTVNFQYTKHENQNDAPEDGEAWATINTMIPTTPFNEQRPTPPTLKVVPDPPHSPAHRIPYPDKPQLTPHQEHIPFDGKEPTPPELKPMPVEPTKPADLSLDTNDIVINYTPSPTKQWEENSVSTNNKIYMNGKTPTANISVNIPNEAHINSFALNEDYSKFSQDASVLSVHVLHDGKLENDSDYTVNDDKNGHLIVTRNNMNGFTGGQYQLITQFKINGNVKPNTVLENNGGVTLNDNETNVPPVKITTWNPNPTKDVNLGDNETANISESANNWHIADGQTLTYPLQNVVLPANRETTFTSWKQTDNLDSHLTYKGFKAFLNGKDVTSHIKMTVNGQHLKMEYDNWLIQQMNTNKAEAFKMPLIMIAATAHGQDGAEIDNKYSITATVKNVGNPKTNPNGNTQEHTVTLTSNTVRNYLIKDIAPVKKDLNTQGVDIDNMNVTPGSVQDYQLIKDFSSYKDAHVSADHQTFYWVDDWPEQALKNPDLTLTKITNQNKQTVTGLTGKVYNSLSEVPEAARQQLEKAGIKLTGTFILWTGNQDFIKNQILTGNKVTISIPGTVKDTFTGKYENKSWTITFGHGAPSNVVVNNVEKINPTKDIVLDANSTKSLNNATIKLGQVFDYKLNGQILPAKTGTPLTQYGWQDKFDISHDQLTGQVKAVALVDIYLKDGTMLKKGTDLTKYITKATNKDGSITWQFKKDFLSQVDLIKGSFGADLFVQAKRIKSGDVKNQYTFWLNGKPYKSNIVISHTPEPAKSQPKTPAPTPTPQLGMGAAPITPAPQQLAQTNIAKTSNNAGLVGLALVGSTLSIAMLGKKKKYTID